MSILTLNIYLYNTCIINQLVIYKIQKISYCLYILIACEAKTLRVIDMGTLCQ